MNFSGELKFPEIDHPGVPVRLLIEGAQAELVVEGESLGRWSLYDIHARRLVASAFQIDLDGTEVTFLADDPVDFAYRGVEHMAETWADMKSKRIARRAIAVRRSRRGAVPSRIEDMKAAMAANLELQAVPGRIAGEVMEPEPLDTEPVAEEAAPEEAPREAFAPEPERFSEEARLIEEEKRRIAEERAQLEEERRIASQREADRIEAYRLEMARLEADREELRRQAAASAQPEQVDAPPVASEPDEAFEPAAASEPDTDPVAPEPEAEEWGADPTSEREAGAVETGRGVVDLNDLEGEEALTPSLEGDVAGPPPTPDTSSSLQPAPSSASEPAISAPTKSGGFMGAVRAAFTSSAKDHEHQFIQAPGGLGITRYVCEECGFVSISV